MAATHNASSDSASIPEASTSGRSDADSAGGPAKIGIIMGSDSDLKTMAAAEEVSKLLLVASINLK